MLSRLSAAGLILILVVVNLAIGVKEVALSRGRTVILQLAPVDPRSLMQGDYMRLDYALLQKLDGSWPDRGTLYLTLDANNVATAADRSPGARRQPLKYRYGKSRYEVGAESFFFQEGQRDLYAGARYGLLKVDGEGNAMLVDLLDGQLRPIRP